MDQAPDKGWNAYHLIGPKLPLKLKEIWGGAHSPSNGATGP
jgi:hypothetical protein